MRPGLSGHPGAHQAPFLFGQRRAMTTKIVTLQSNDVWVTYGMARIEGDDSPGGPSIIVWNGKAFTASLMGSRAGNPYQERDAVFLAYGSVTPIITQDSYTVALDKLTREALAAGVSIQTLSALLRDEAANIQTPE